MVEAPAAFTFTLTVEGLALIEKSWTTNVTIDEWDSRLLVPVTSTCLLPVELNVQERVALPEPVTDVGETVHEDVVFVARLTIAAKPSSPVTVMLDIAALLLFSLTFAGEATIVKSWTV